MFVCRYMVDRRPQRPDRITHFRRTPIFRCCRMQPVGTAEEAAAAREASGLEEAKVAEAAKEVAAKEAVARLGVMGVMVVAVAMAGWEVTEVAGWVEAEAAAA